jgi:hypothetical protein
MRVRQARLWTAIGIGICPATVTKSMPRLSQRVIGFAGRRAADLLRTPPTQRASNWMFFQRI